MNTPDYHIRQSDGEGDTTEHLCPPHDAKTALCGVEGFDMYFGTIGGRTSGEDNVYDAIEENIYLCPSCAEMLLDDLGLPANREEANEKVGREVY